jgi:hypothetical protein
LSRKLTKICKSIERQNRWKSFFSTQFHIEPGKWAKDQTPFLSLERVSKREVDREKNSTVFASPRVKVAEWQLERAKERLKERCFDCAMVCFSRRPQRLKTKITASESCTNVPKGKHDSKITYTFCKQGREVTPNSGAGQFKAILPFNQMFSKSIARLFHLVRLSPTHSHAEAIHERRD